MRSTLPIVLLVAAAVVAGCGDEDEPTGSTTTAPATSTTASESQPDNAPEPQGGDGQTGEQSSTQAGGGDGGGDPEPRPLTVEAVTEVVLTGGTAPQTICGELVTERLLRAAYGSRQGCLAAVAPGAGAKSVEVRKVSEEGSRASALALPSGGPYDGIEIEVALVADPQLDGAWVLDELVADIPAGP